ncbi:LCP family protein [Lipingzhangella sp. LS1_29]|uniref:LCP family protein n=1 Tax=Lipingzhangella rawalii TaxID=2055835 RepID=A0ABU2H2P8_9ACTN|nr:LCP family protein [Lipingzhangella rawalii]MDS1268894.1 LCP family protein [Lipingzhangella rawalii]
MADQSEEQPQDSESRPDGDTSTGDVGSAPRPRDTRDLGTALAWTAGATAIPGLGHLRAGHRVLGSVILGTFLTCVGLATVMLMLFGDEIASSSRMFLQTDWLLGLAAATALGAVLWIATVIHSYLLLRPRGTRPGLRVLAVGVVTLLCLVVATPAAGVLHISYTAYATMSNVFAEDDEERPHDASDPWDGRDRISVLLMGNDGHPQRQGEIGTRIDSMMVANIDVEHGDVILIGLPRNLEDIPFPPGTALDERYPDGYDQLLLDIYQTVQEEPQGLAIDPTADDPAADTVRETVSHALNLDIDYYAMIDMRGFRDIVDAIGGVQIRITEPIPWGHQGDVLEEGMQTLTGQEALWYVRSRIGSDDYTRMGRQGCLVQAIAEQADPWTVLTSFQELARATEVTLGTDIPQSKLRHFVDVAELVPDGRMRTLQLSPPQVDPPRPNWIEIRSMVSNAVQEQEAAQAGPSGTDAADAPAEDEERNTADAPDTQEQETEPATGEEQRTDWQEWSGSDEPEPQDPGRQAGAQPSPLDELCP